MPRRLALPVVDPGLMFYSSDINTSSSHCRLSRQSLRPVRLSCCVAAAEPTRSQSADGVDRCIRRGCGRWCVARRLGLPGAGLNHRLADGIGGRLGGESEAELSLTDAKTRLPLSFYWAPSTRTEIIAYYFNLNSYLNLLKKMEQKS